MKKKIKLFLSSVVFICGIFTSCENLLSVKEEKQTEQSYIRISTNLSSVDRSVLPSNYFTKDTTGLTWTLSGSRNGTAEITIKVWNDEGDTAAITQTAYQKMINDSFIPVDEGTWIFTLTAENDSGKVLEATITQTITGGQNTLSFVMEEAVGKGAASGQIEFTLKWKELNVVGNVAITLSKRNDSNFSDITSNLSPLPSAEKNYEYVSYSAEADSPLTPGNYILKLELQQDTTEATENPSAEPNYTTINTYTCLIHVAPGLCSKDEVTLKTLAPLYKVNFEGIKGIEFKESIVPTSYNAYTTFALPTIKKEDGYEYQWYKISSNSPSQDSVDDPSNVSIKEDTTFGVKCYKIVDKNDIVRTAKGDSTGDSFSIGTAEGLGIFRDLVNGSHEDLKMVDKSGGSEEAFVYYKTGLVNYKTQLNAKLTSDIDLTQSDGNELSWVPINGYSGTFDGGGYTITVNNTYQVNGNLYYQGFFDTLDGATIKNLVVAGEETISESGLEYCGGIASQIENARGVNTTFENCVNKRNITVSADVKGIGGFAGYTSSNNSVTTNFVNCINLGTIKSEYSGIDYSFFSAAGFTTGATSYEKCINAGNVLGSSVTPDGTLHYSTVAGFDASDSAIFTDCINLGDISANSYTTDDGIAYSTEKVYGFSSIESDNFPTFTNCIDAGSAKYPFTGVGDDITVTYNSCYYNSDSYGSNYNTDGLSCMSSNDLCIQEKTKFSNWYYDSSNSRYPLPNIVKSETTEGVSSEIWQEVVAKATLPKGTRGNPFTTWEELANYVSTSSDSEATVYITGDISVTSTISLANAVSLSSLVINPVGTVTISRNESMLYKFFDVQKGKSLSIVGTENEKITFSGGSIESKDSMFGINDASVSFEYCQFKDALSSIDLNTVAILRITGTENTTSVSIKNCTFEENTLYDVYIANCPSLILSGNVEIPKLYFKNELTSSKLTINVDEDLTGSVNIVLDKYEDEGALTYDLDLFNLVDGTSLPEGVFTLNNPCYAINPNGTIAGITTYSDWTTLANDITDASNTTSEFVLKGDITATSTITVSREITLKAPVGTTITRGADTAFTGAFFDNQSTLTLEGITLDGGSTGEISIQAEAPLIMSSGNLTLNNCTLQNNTNSNATETGTGIFLQINDTSSLCSFNDVSFGSDEIPHIKIKNDTGKKFTFNLGGSLERGVPSIDMPSTTCINITESLTIPDGESIKITLDEYTIGNRIISANEGINLVRENFSLTTTEESWFIDSAGYLVGGSVTEPGTSESGEYVVSSFENLLWIALELKRGSITSFNIKLTEDIEIPSDKWQFYQLNVSNSSTIDGQGHSITINDVDVSKFGNDAGGLFYKLNNSTVKNLVLKGSITANTSAGGYIGALCRSAYKTTIQNVMSTVEIIDKGSGDAGGLVGYFGGYSDMNEWQPGSFIQNCAVYANVTSTNGTVGGLVGCTWSGYQCWQINNCIYKGNVTGGTDQGVGAIIGTHKTGRTSTFKDTWYCADGTSEIVGKYNNQENGKNFNGYEGTVISKTADQIATAEAATLLNTNSDDTSNVIWEYVSGDYPTLKSVN